MRGAAVDGEEPVEDLVRAEIGRDGAISFARFMELALYAPGTGYYSRRDRRIGKRGDFYTSVSVGPTFGSLLAVRFAEWVRQAGWSQWELVEAGAHDGQLLDDILTAMSTFEPDVFAGVRCRVLEPMAARQAAQRARLASWGERVIWGESWGAFRQPVQGVIVANELLDAFPVHRLAWDASRRVWFEWGVGLESGRLDWYRMEPGVGLLPRSLEFLEPVLPDGFILEVSPAAADWWAATAGALRQGWLAAFDYGFAQDDAVSAERVQGTARAYYQHRSSADLLARPGEQDLTAHVDFGRLVRVGEAAGLRTDVLLPQGRWLGGVATDIVRAGGARATWLVRHARQLQTLTHPAHLGHSFRVLIQSRGVEPAVRCG